MATDNSWIVPLGQNIQNAFGLSPRAAAEGRTMQAEQAAAQAKMEESQANANRVRTMTPYEVAKLIAEKDTTIAQGGLHTANTEKVGAETAKISAEREGVEDMNKARKALVFAFQNGALMTDPQTGELTFNPNAGGEVMGRAIGMMNPNDIPKLPQLLAGLNQNISGQSMTAASNARMGGANVTAVSPVIQAAAFDNSGGNGLQRTMSVSDQKAYTDVVKNTAESLKLRYTNSSQELSDKEAYAIAERATALYPNMRPDLAVDRMLTENNLTIGPLENNWFSDDQVGLRRGDPGDDNSKRKNSRVDPYSFTPISRQPSTIAGAIAPQAPAPAPQPVTPAQPGITQVGVPVPANPAIASPVTSTGNPVTDHNVAKLVSNAVAQENGGTPVNAPAINPTAGQPSGVRVITTAQEAAAVKEGEVINVQGKILKKMNGQFIQIQ